ncbi:MULTISPECIES: hemolysin family protein [Bacillaceae]|uniref:Hemolysin family protein n=1 Tax=Evansella alkalicola TaxID=745819 RepID=A0ABS6JYS4_9BACI|nr:MULTISPECIES: hemolysin family protein [Bacillaceae]MBU9723739.1 hemolysin family protein [Bacillus alkalicola]
MTGIPIGLTIMLILLTIMSAFFSSAETAYSSANRLRVKTLSEEGNIGAKRSLYILDHFDNALSTILVGNNLVNIALATISAQLATDIFGPSLGVFISTFVVTTIILIFGEILPKSFAKEFAEFTSAKYSFILVTLMKILTPVTWLFLQLRKLVSSLIRKSDNPSVTEEELKELVKISNEEGIIDEVEKELVHRSFDFNDIIVAEVFKPRTDMIAVDSNVPIEAIKEVFIRESYSRIPVFDGDIDNIIGILSERDFLKAYIKEGDNFRIQELLRQPVFVVETMKIHTLLPQLQKNKGHMAIVIDEYGGTSGLITLEDILEELVGEIWDEHDDDEKHFQEIDESTFIFNGDYPIDDFVRLTGIELPDTTYHTLGGWLSDIFQRIPQKNEELTYEHIHLQITESDDRRVHFVRVTINNEMTLS